MFVGQFPEVRNHPVPAIVGIPLTIAARPEQVNVSDGQFAELDKHLDRSTYYR